MSLKRRNVFAWLLLLTAAICWASSIRFRPHDFEGAAEATTISTVATAETTFPTDSTTEISSPEVQPGEAQNRSNGSKAISLILGFAAVLLSGIAIFVFRQKNPFFGPDLICILSAFLFWICGNTEAADSIYFWDSARDFLVLLSNTLINFAVLLAIREIYEWICAKLPLSWCAVSRIAARCTSPQFQLLAFAGGIILSVAGVALCVNALVYSLLRYVIPMVFLLFSGVLSALCLWRYGVDLNHFQKQLENYRKGEPISVRKGSFAETEKKLLDAQAQHEEAVRTAVTSERFKVELISNVSHDLRTPLTSILGYGELLQGEDLSPEGKERLSWLNQKAGYMRDLVESLFELTKVSSGVLESRKSEIDLIRLLEQTIGLFDDQLMAAGLEVRRHYTREAIPVVTDGPRMHQVFANLLTNAIKYALPGTRIYLEVGEEQDSYRIRMVNTASYEMDFTSEEIVQRFARGDKARSTQGSGLGLAIAQTYTESVDGRFRVVVDGDQFSAIVELPKN